MAAWKSVGKQNLLGIGSENMSLKFSVLRNTPIPYNSKTLCIYLCDCLHRKKIVMIERSRIVKSGFQNDYANIAPQSVARGEINCNGALWLKRNKRVIV